ncbi:MAG: phosphatidylethanolamine N-methyltransferase family protein [Planctomycetota bacterium]
MSIRLPEPLKPVQRLLDVVVGMSGFRLDLFRLDGLILAWSVLWLASVIGIPVLFRSGLLGVPAALAYAIIAFFVYYGGLTWILGLKGRRMLIAGLGPSRSTLWFEACLGMAFTHQGLCQGVVAELTAGGFPSALPDTLTTIAGIALMVLGFGVKIWSTWLVGLDVYYYRDMFLRRHQPKSEAFDSLVKHGPYRWLANPMYGVGNISAYGLAILHRSWPGLVIAATAQSLIYLFYYGFEKPFVDHFYESSDTESSSQAA